MKATIKATSISGVWFRQIPASGDPLFRPDPPPNGRWQQGKNAEALYLADSEQTAWAEWYRALEELALPPERQLPRELWSFAVELDRVADLSGADALARLDLPLPHPSRKQWGQFQAVGEQLFTEGWKAIVYPSAAQPEAQALCISRSAVEIAGVIVERLRGRHDTPPAPDL